MDQIIDINDPPIAEQTEHLGLPLPVAGNPLHYDLGALRAALTLLDSAVHSSASDATVAALQGVVDGIISGAPENLDTLQKIASALGGDPAFAATLADQISDLQTSVDGKLSDLPATATRLGGIKVGSGLLVEPDGRLSTVAGGSGSGLPVYSDLVIQPSSNGQTAFNLAGGYSPGQIDVHINGVMLNGNGDDYTATNGTSITLAAGASTTDTLTIRRWIYLPAAQAVNKTGDTMTGGLTVPSLNGGQIAGFRNRVQNGKMDVSRKGASFPALANGATFVERFKLLNTSAAVLTGSQQADAPAGGEFQNSLRLAVTTADASIAAGDVCGFQHIIEGYNVRDFVGRDFVLSFPFRSSKTGIHCVSLSNGVDRSMVIEFNVTTANAWEYKEIPVAGGLPSSGTWNFTNGAGLVITFALAAGSTYQAPAGSWQNGVFYATANQVNCLDAVGNIVAATGIQAEPGLKRTPFEHRPYDIEMAMCQRHLPMVSGLTFLGSGFCSSATQCYVPVVHAVQPRVAPTGLVISSLNHFQVYGASAAAIVPTSVTLNAGGTQASMVGIGVASGLTNGNATALFANAAGSFLYFTGVEL